MIKRYLWIALCALLLTAGSARAEEEEEAPPTDAKSLCEIVQLLEKAGYSQVAEASYEDGAWKLEAYRNGERRIAILDARTGEIKSERSDDDD